MTKVTLKEFSFIANENDELKERIKVLLDPKNKENFPDVIIELAKEYGYELTDAFAPQPDIVKLDDETLETVVGGKRGVTHDDEYFNYICEAFMWVLRMDKSLCR